MRHKYGIGDPEWYGKAELDMALPIGLFAKEQALDAHEANTWDLLPRCRLYLKTLYKSTLRPVTADDARAWLDIAQIPESQRGERLDWMGALFRGDEWEAVGYRQSEVPANHARIQREWRLK